MIFRMVSALCAVLAVSCCPAASSALTIDFESLMVADSSSHSVSSPYFEDGFQVASTNGVLAFASWGTASPHFAGSTGLANNDAAMTTLSKVDNSAFDVASIDLSDFFNVVASNSRIIIHFQAVHQNASTITHTLDVPRFFGFQTFPLPGFTNITSLSWDQSAHSSVPHQFDNIVIIPEPVTATLFLLGRTFLAENGKINV